MSIRPAGIAARIRTAIIRLFACQQKDALQYCMDRPIYGALVAR